MKRSSPTPAIVLAISLALTLAATLLAVSTTDATDRARFEHAAQTTEDRITARIGTYVAILRATSGLFASRAAEGRRVQRDEFRAFITSLDLARSYPGITTIGFSPRLARDDRDTFVAQVRRTDRSDFRIWPEHESGEYHPTLYVEPLDERSRSALGYDMYSQPTRREAMQRARDTGAPAFSGKVMLDDAIDERQQPGFVLYVPIYAGGAEPNTIAARRAALSGFAYCPLRASDLFGRAFESDLQPRAALQVYDGGAIAAPALLHDSRSVADRARVPGFSLERKLDAAGRSWTIVMTPTAFFERNSRSPAIPITAAAGVVLSLAFFIASRAQAAARAAAERAADQVRRSLAKREQAEHALHESSRRVQVIIDALPVLVSFVDSEQRYRFVSRAYQDWFGLPCNEIVGKSMSEVLGERAFGELRPYIERVMRGENVTFEAPLTYLTGPRIVHATYTPHFSESGGVEGFIALVADITKQKQSGDWQRFLANATGVLASSMDYAATLRSVAELSVPAIADDCTVYMVDPGAGLQPLAAAHVDPAQRERFARAERRCLLEPNASLGPAHVLRTGIAELIPQLSADALDAIVADPERRSILRSLRLRSAMTVPLRFRDEVMGVITFTVGEQSLRHYTEEDLQRAEDLARRAASAIENARLYAAAQEAIRVRDEFLSIASHELKTPLTPLQLQLDSLAAALRNAEPKNDVLNRRLETANRQVRRLTKLVENLLDVSRISAGRLSLEREPCDLGELAAECAERLGADAAAVGCRVSVHADQPVVGSWDRLRLEQVFSNLISNALKYGAGKPIEVEVRKESGVANVRIADHGIGIAAEDRTRIFGRFERAVPLTHYGGMGLGLYIARQIVEAHGGAIGVDSTPGCGSVFSVRLPLTATEGERPAIRDAVVRGALQ